MHKILIVDDSETLRTQLRESLEGVGYRVIQAADGREGLEQARTHPDLSMIITDYNMPEMDGVTMASRIRELGGLSQIPIFMLTTEATADLKAAGKEAGILAWVVKPLVPAKILPAIAKVLQRQAS